MKNAGSYLTSSALAGTLFLMMTVGQGSALADPTDGTVEKPGLQVSIQDVPELPETDRLEALGTGGGCARRFENFDHVDDVGRRTSFYAFIEACIAPAEDGAWLRGSVYLCQKVSSDPCDTYGHPRRPVASSASMALQFYADGDDYQWTHVCSSGPIPSAALGTALYGGSRFVCPKSASVRWGHRYKVCVDMDITFNRADSSRINETGQPRFFFDPPCVTSPEYKYGP